MCSKTSSNLCSLCAAKEQWVYGSGLHPIQLVPLVSQKHSSCPSLLALILSVLFSRPSCCWEGLRYHLEEKVVWGNLLQECQLKVCCPKMVLYFTAVLMPFSLSIIKAVMLKYGVSFSVVSCLQKAALFFFASYTLYPRQPLPCALTPQPVT